MWQERGQLLIRYRFPTTGIYSEFILRPGSCDLKKNPHSKAVKSWNNTTLKVRIGALRTALHTYKTCSCWRIICNFNLEPWCPLISWQMITPWIAYLCRIRITAERFQLSTWVPFHFSFVVCALLKTIQKKTYRKKKYIH